MNQYCIFRNDFALGHGTLALCADGFAAWHAAFAHCQMRLLASLAERSLQFVLPNVGAVELLSGLIQCHV